MNEKRIKTIMQEPRLINTPIIKEIETETTIEQNIIKNIKKLRAD